MKKSMLFAGFIFLIVLFACKKSDTDNTDYSIVVNNISKTLPSQERLSVTTLYNSLYFELREDSIGIYNPVVTQYICLECNEGIQEILTDDSAKDVLPIVENTTINSNGKWIEPFDLNLSKFAGKGELYIGFRSASSLNFEKGIYNYGWIKIDLSQNMSSLTVINSAVTRKTSNSIKAGQVN